MFLSIIGRSLAAITRIFTMEGIIFKF